MPIPGRSVAVLDDHLLIADAIERMVIENKAYTYFGSFSKSSELENAIAANQTPAYLLLDINLQGEDGIELCKKYTKQFPGMKIIMLTGLNQPSVVKNAIKSGAKGFMLKNMQQEEFWECIDKVGNGETYLHKEIEKIILQNSLHGKSKDDSYLPKLSRREREVLELILKEMTTQEIADALFISVNTVETHRASLFTKTGARNIAGLVKITIEKGLLDN